MKALIVGSSISCVLGLVLGAHLKPGPASGPPNPQPEAQGLAQWVAPAAEAADAVEPPDAPSPILYVKSGGRWVSEIDREAARIAAQDQAAEAVQQAQDLSYIDQAQGVIEPPLQISAPAEPATATLEPETSAPPPPIVISALQPDP